MRGAVQSDRLFHERSERFPSSCVLSAGLRCPYLHDCVRITALMPLPTRNGMHAFAPRAALKQRAAAADGQGRTAGPRLGSCGKDWALAEPEGLGLRVLSLVTSLLLLPARGTDVLPPAANTST